jgi:hypothetical protein
VRFRPSPLLHHSSLQPFSNQAQYARIGDRFLENLRERLAKFGLELHPDKTRRIEFGRFAEENRRRRGEGKPETFDFLGFTHVSGKNSLARFMVRRKTIRKRIRGKLRKIKCVVNRHYFQLVCLAWTQRHESGCGGWNCFSDLRITASSV